MGCPISLVFFNGDLWDTLFLGGGWRLAPSFRFGLFHTFATQTHPAVDDFLGDRSALDNKDHAVVLLWVVVVDTASINGQELIGADAEVLGEEVESCLATALGEALVIADGAGEGVGGTDDVELGGVGQVVDVFGEVLKSFAGVVVEVVFVEFPKIRGSNM